MSLNGVVALFCVTSPNSITLEANYITVVEDRPIMSAEYSTQNLIVAAIARSPCDSWATCSLCHKCLLFMKILLTRKKKQPSARHMRETN